MTKPSERRLAALLAAAVLLLAVLAGNVAAARAVAPVVGVEAVVLADVPAAYPSDNAIVPPSGPARVAWTAGDGSTAVATATVPAGTRAGESRRLWVAPDGSVVPRPPAGPGPAVAALLTLLTGATVAAGVLAAHRAGTGRARRRGLEREWARVEPGWSGRAR